MEAAITEQSQITILREGGGSLLQVRQAEVTAS